MKENRKSKIAKEVSKELPILDYDSKKEPRRSMQTFLRNQNKFATTASAMADRKAMIMIRINTTIVSAIVIFFKYLDDVVQYGALFGGILMIGCGAALACSVLAAKPNGFLIRRYFRKEIKPKYPDLSYNTFVTFTSPYLSEYEESMAKVTKSQDLQIGNQVRFNYLMEKYLLHKYLLLDVAYTIFLISLTAVGMIFMYGKFIA